MGFTNGCFDNHCHVFRTDLPMIAHRRYTPEYDALPQNLCDLLLKHRLNGAVLIQPSFLGSDNSYMLDTLSRFAGHEKLTFKGVVVLDPRIKPDKQTLTTMDRLGVIGVRLNLFGQKNSFDYKLWKALLMDVEERGWHIELHCEARKMAGILPTLVRNHTKVVVDHLGLVTDIINCTGLKTILQQPAERLWIKKSAPYRLNFPGEQRALLKHIAELNRIFQNHVGVDRMLWGSDWPFTQFENKTTYDEMIKFCN